MGEFDRRNVVVTGGAQGIGLAISNAFANAGARVFALDVDAEALAELDSPIQGIECDVANVVSLEAACASINEAGPVDVIVNNAGIGGEWPSIFESSIDEWDRVLNINLRSIFLTARFLVPNMRPGASIVNIASTRAFMSEANTEPYSASKGGVVALTHSLAISLAEKRIRVNCISPGWIDTARHQKKAVRHEPALRPQDHEFHPVGRVGVPEDIAQACIYLASPSASFITGANLVVDGGVTKKMIYPEGS